MSEPIKQFVLLHHKLSNSSHWDLMLDVGEALATWQLLDDPTRFDAVRAKPLGDHRRIYLDYEGPVSGDRGHVTRLDRGEYHNLDRQATRWQFQLAGHLLKGHYELAPEAAPQGGWVLRRVST